MDRHPGHHPPGRLGEELRARRPPSATPSGCTPTPTRPTSARRSRRLFGVHVVDVRTLSVKSKPKRRGNTRGRTRRWKKAIVQVRTGEQIPVFQGLAALEE